MYPFTQRTHVTSVRPMVLACVLLVPLFVLPQSVIAQAQLMIQVAERERWHGEDNLYGEGYGWRIAMVGNRLVTASWHQAVVWEHEAGDWHAVQVLDPSVGRIEDVAISGNWIAFGSPHDLYGLAPPIGGDVSLFRYTADSVWVEHPVILGEPDNSLTGYEVHSFGSSVDLDSTRLVVSAPDSRECCEGNTDGPGFVFIYTWDGANWVMDDWVTSSDPWRFFGASIDLMGDYLIVGAPRDPDHAGPNEYGAAFVFVDELYDWNMRGLANPITTPDAFNDMNFGRHVGATTGPWFAVAADNGVKFLTPTAIPLPWEDHIMPLPGRRTSRLTDGISCDLDRVLYVDSANDEVAVVSIVDNQWAELQVLTVGIVTTEPVGVAISGQRAAVGYPYEDLAGPNTGAILTYTYSDQNGWVVDEVLTYGDATPGDKFGIAIDVASTGGGNALAIVGAPNDLDGQTRAGAAYIYRYNAFEDAWDKLERWQPGSDLTAVGPRGSPGFGTAVACDGYNRLAVGAPDNAVNGQWTGSVHVRHEGSGVTMLVPANSEEWFGASLAYQNDTLIVGAPLAEEGAGVVYAYTYSDQDGAWGVPERLDEASMRTAGFGTALALDEPNGTLVIGAPRGTGVDLFTGAVHVFGRGVTWVSEDRLVVADGTSGDLFGQAVAVGGGFLFVGAPGDDTAANDGGSVHVFEWALGAWTHVDEFTALDAQPGDAFGSSMWLSGDDLFIGAPGVDNAASEVGAVYTYRRFGTTWVAATGRIVHSNPVDYDRGANPVAYIGGMLLTGAVGEDGAAEDAGAVIVHSYSAHVEVPSPLDPGPGGQPCQGDFEVTFSQTMVSPIDPAVYHYYADQVDVSGDTMAVGELAAETTYINAQGQAQIYPIGAVHIYRRTAINAWTLEQTIFPPAEDVVPTWFVANFGVSLALDGDLLVVGNGNGYFVHVYERTPGGWTLRTRIASEMSALQGFGASLDVSGSTIMIGAWNYTETDWPPGAGAVLFYERIDEDTWGLNAGPLLSQFHVPYSEHLGKRVSLNSAAGWAVATGTGLEGYRSVYVYQRVGGVWQEVAILNADLDGASNYFGRTGLAIDGNTVVVGDQFYSVPPLQSGAAFVWEHDGVSWNGPTVLLGSSPSRQDHAGTSVAVDGDIIVVGAPTAKTVYPGGLPTGAAYVFGRQGGLWSERLRLMPNDTAVRSFGHSTSVSGGIVLSGTPSQYGAFLYAYDLGCAPLPCPGDFNGDGVRDLADFAIMQSNFGLTGADHADGDADGDGDVDLDDLSVFITNLGVPCP